MGDEPIQTSTPSSPKLCEFCAKPLSGFQRRFCSHKCSGEATSGPKTYETKQCKQCQVSFTSEAFRHKEFCTKTCSNRYKNDIRQAAARAEKEHPCGRCGAATTNRRFCSLDCAYNNPGGSRGYGSDAIKCSHCGIEFHAAKSEGRKYCSNKCSAAASKVPDRPCEICGTMFYNNQRKIKTCGVECGRESMIRSRSVQWDGAWEARSCKTCGNEFPCRKIEPRMYCKKECHDITRFVKPREIYEIDCANCGKHLVLETVGNDPKRKYCSKKCSRVNLARKIGANRYHCIDGHQAVSKGELAIDNWLYGHSLLHATQAQVSKYVADFKVGEYYIEYWGMVHYEPYDEQRAAKEEYYTANSIKYIGIEQADLENLDVKLSVLLAPANSN